MHRLREGIPPQREEVNASKWPSKEVNTGCPVSKDLPLMADSIMVR